MLACQDGLTPSRFRDETRRDETPAEDREEPAGQLDTCDHEVGLAGDVPWKERSGEEDPAHGEEKEENGLH